MLFVCSRKVSLADVDIFYSDSLSRNLAFKSKCPQKSNIVRYPRVAFIECRKVVIQPSFCITSSLFKKAQLQENCINLIIWRLTKAESSPTWSSMVGEKNWHFDHVPYLGIPKYFRLWLYKDRSSSICKVWFGQMNKQSSKNYSNRTEKWKSRQ